MTSQISSTHPGDYHLAIDTSTPRGSLALLRTQAQTTDVVQEVAWERVKSHSEWVTFEWEKIQQATGVTLSDLKFISVGVGPGSFTGLRVAVNFARSLAYCLDIPIVALPSTRIVAASALTSIELPVFVMMNAFRNLVYVAAYRSSSDNETEELLAPMAVTIENLPSLLKEKQYLCLGDAYELFDEHLPSSTKDQLLRDSQYLDRPQAPVLGREAAKLYIQQESIDWRNLKPLYIRASEAEEKLLKLKKA